MLLIIARIFMIFTNMGAFIIQLYQKSDIQMLKSYYVLWFFDNNTINS